MTTLFLDRPGLALHHNTGGLVLLDNNRRIAALPDTAFSRVVIGVDMPVSTRLLARLARKDIGVTLLGGGQDPHAVCLPGAARADVRTRLAQYRLFLDDAARSRWASRLLSAKTAAQISVLAKARAQRSDLRYPLGRALVQLRRTRLELTASLQQHGTPGLASLLGMEGTLAAAYFCAYARLFAPALGFAGRRRRPPPDPVNACLSLAYTLLHAEAVRAAHAHGLDPYLGFYHQPAVGRESLACDLIEPLRPKVDQWVWLLFRERQLRPEDFRHSGQGCRLQKAGRLRFYAAFEPLLTRLAAGLKRECRVLVHALRALRPEEAQPEPGNSDDEHV